MLGWECIQPGNEELLVGNVCVLRLKPKAYFIAQVWSEGMVLTGRDDLESLGTTVQNSGICAEYQARSIFE